MKDEGKTKEQLISELVKLRQRITELEAAETERKGAEEKMRQHTAQLDPLRQVGLELTALYKLRYFYETLEKEIQRSERYHRSVSLIIVDIDDFKAYNDLHGHVAGDDLLRELGQVISKATRRTDTLVRYGGEEFAIILPETETEGARFLAERVLEDVREHRFSMQHSLSSAQITLSMGVATYPNHADDAEGLVDAADNALLQAKREGKDRICVHKPSAA